MKVAIPQLGDSVAPRFEAARCFVVSTIENNKIRSTHILECIGTEDYRRVRMLKIHGVTTLICNGIKASYKDMLVASGVVVIPNISSTVKNTLEEFLKCKLVPEEVDAEDVGGLYLYPHEDLVDRARSLFENSGYMVKPGPGQDSFLIDLVAEICCPLCRRRVTVAICCGAHTYRSDLEITEFHRATPSSYNARVYFYPSLPSVRECCREYGIELIDPDYGSLPAQTDDQGKIPLLRGSILGHENASGNASNK